MAPLSHSKPTSHAPSLSPSSAASLSKVKRYHPYFTPTEIAYLSDKQRGKASQSVEERARLQAVAFIEAVGSRLGFPHRTIATAQTLYNRFHLFFPLKDFSYYDVTLASLYVSSKMHDTLKKPRDILHASYFVRFPEMALKAKANGSDVPDIDQNTLELDRRRLLAIERLVLETICFNFKVRMPFDYVIKCGRELGASKELTKLAYRLAIDSHRTLAPLQHPPHAIALACIYLAALLTAFPEHGGSSPLEETEWCEAPPHAQESGLDGTERKNRKQRRVPVRGAREIGEGLSRDGEWGRRFGVRVVDLEDIVHHLIDLLMSQATPNLPNSLSTSPSSPFSPQSPSPHPSPQPHTNVHITQSPSQSFSATHLTRLKIFLREKEMASVRPPLSNTDPSAGYVSAAAGGLINIPGSNGNVAAEVWGEGLGRNEGTVRFQFEKVQEQAPQTQY